MKNNNDQKPTEETHEPSSFLTESQLEGRAEYEKKQKTKEESFLSLDDALKTYWHILDKGKADELKKITPEELPKAQMSVYCQDCRAIVTAGMGETQRGRPRMVCGTCGSKKIARGREESLKKFYHLEKKA